MGLIIILICGAYLQAGFFGVVAIKQWPMVTLRANNSTISIGLVLFGFQRLGFAQSMMAVQNTPDWEISAKPPA
ncbi:MAG: hypothetical protein JSR71_08475 [Proteobacteria bacterium]|nr:hypothetical protein [Pseudomonadota bacterium]